MPKMCLVCGIFEGEAQGHDWNAWQVEEDFGFDLFSIALSCSEIADITKFYATLSSIGELTVHEAHIDTALNRSCDFVRKNIKETEKAESALVGSWACTDFTINNQQQTGTNAAYSAVFHKDGTLELKLDNDVCAQWIFLKNMTGLKGCGMAEYYKYAAYIPDTSDFYNIHLINGELSIHTFKNSKNYNYLFQQLEQ